MANIRKEVIVDGEKIYLQRSNYGIKLLDYWRVISPYKDETGKINWFNLLFGGYSNLLFLIIATVFFILLTFGFQEIFSGCQAIANNPCLYCKSLVTP
jgi:hypothetical protein